VERDEFEKVYWELHPGLLGYARGQLDDAAAHDAVAATFLTLWQKDLAYPVDDGAARRLTALAYEVLRGHVTNEYRSRERRTALWRRLVSDGERIVDSVRHSDGASSVRYWLGRLSDADRHVIALFNVGYSVEEMAEILGCSVPAAARRRDRAKARLREIITTDGGGR
jgi:RNA polymerase sigma factor (sigma-70 family)